MNNLKRAAKIIEFARSVGVLDFCVCAGARNSPFITLIDSNKNLLNESGRIFHFFEERCASFFALGRAQQMKRPVAIITTSGTAVSELYSAVIEAYYTETPLLLITADRPAEYRGTGAPQSIEQIGIFSHYSEPTLDFFKDLSPLDDLHWNQKRPLHLNVCFDEPLLTGEIPILTQFQAEVSNRTKGFIEKSDKEELLQEQDAPLFFKQCQSPLFIFSGIDEIEIENLLSELKKYQFSFPCWVETLSGLRGNSLIEPTRIKSGEKLIQYLISKNYFDGVVRVGSVPTTRIWRDLEEIFNIPVLNLTNSSFSGLSRKVEQRSLNYFSKVLEYYENKTSKMTSSFWSLDQSLSDQIDEYLDLLPRAQLSLVRNLSKQIKNDELYLGNSLPIREWDWIASPYELRRSNGNRGANGIDGQLSSFFGWMSEKSLHSWALLGDLTTLYDLAAPWILPQLSNRNWTVVVMNNSGGQIFAPMFGKEAFLNRHEIKFEFWAKMWGLSYTRLEAILGDFESKPQILELSPLESETLQLREKINELWKKRLL